MIFIFWLSILLSNTVLCQQNGINRAPQFLPNGDMSRFAVPEDTSVGSPVYRLIGVDPEGSKVTYSISGEYFTVDKDTGIVSTLKPFDREKLEMITVIISITDEAVGQSESNTISLQRQISVLDINDNSPNFLNRPYSFEVFENIEVGQILYDNITVVDADGGVNGDVILSCISDKETCDIFNIFTEKITDGIYKGVITLHKLLDYERRTSYSLSIKATDRAKDPSKRLTSTANVVIDVLDVQDQLPMFINSPYFATVVENTEQGTQILQIKAKDGDVGDPRSVRLELVNDHLGYFKLIPVNETANLEEKSYHTASYNLVTSNIPIDREHPHILQNGGIYLLTIRATELINNELPADNAETTVTIVVTDIDDQLPQFNMKEFHTNVTEDISLDSPLPGINMIVNDKDVGENARFYLSIRNVKNAKDTFTVHPSTGIGHTAVVIRVHNTSKLDYDTDDEDLRNIVLDVVVSIRNNAGIASEVGSCRVYVTLQDTNDNVPIFTHSFYHISIPENTPANIKLQQIQAIDKDSGTFGDITYYLRGFGAQNFRTHPKDGGIYSTNSALDYEKQKSFSLNLVAQDGGNKSSAANIYIEIEDINDNKPIFEQKEYLRIIRDNSDSFQPEFFVHATDIDGPRQGGGKVKYSIHLKNFNNDIFQIDEDTGELIIIAPVSSSDTPKGQYEMIIRATDFGTPPLHADTRVNIRVGIAGNQRPIFKGNGKNENGVAVYKVNVKENISPNQSVAKLEAYDPDGADSSLNYYILKGGKDNFAIDKKTGELMTSTYANLDLDKNEGKYDLQVIAVDSGYPVPETGSIVVTINVEDVNNKSPYFLKNEDLYLSSTTSVNSTIAVIRAQDNDTHANLTYRLMPSVKAFDKSGFLVKNSPSYFDSIFKINSKTGEIILNHSIDEQLVSFIQFTVEVEDTNAEEGEQRVQQEKIIYMQSFDSSNPIFVHSNWTTLNPVIIIETKEEQEPNCAIYTFKVRDPERNISSVEFSIIENDRSDLFALDGPNLIVLKKIDFESLYERTFRLKVRATVEEDFTLIPYDDPEAMVVDLQWLPHLRYTITYVQVTVLNINDHPPKFKETFIHKRILENIKYPQVVATVEATDEDDETEVSSVKYFLLGESFNFFQINSTTGEITVSPNASLDREKQNIYNFQVVAMDSPLNGETKIHKVQANIRVEVLDVNDNPPKFSKSLYSAVIPESVDINTEIIQISATDPDLGLSAEIKYEIFEDNDAQSFFRINATTGYIFTNRILTGKGRSEPYNIIIRASDRGDQVLDANGKQTQKSLSSEVTLNIYVGDVVKNDGVPVFIRPSLDQVAKISENASLNSPVFQVIATDPDDINSPEGEIRYKFLDDGKFGKELPFKINQETGLITTKTMLDRETRASFDIIIVAYDRGEMPQQTTRVLHVEVIDVDDHKPYFKRTIDEHPQRLQILEEQPIGTEVDFIEAFDEDIGENALIDYIFSYGNEEGFFNITRSEDNRGLITVAKNLDRETQDTYLLTIKCYKYDKDATPLNYYRPYNQQDLSEKQIIISIEDIDDNKPKFTHSQITLGVRLNVPPDTSLLTIKAEDIDAGSAPIEYYIKNVTFQRLGTSKEKKNVLEKLFYLDSTNGELRTLNTIIKYSDGFFEIFVSANNTKNTDNIASLIVKVFVLRDRGLLKFVFNKPPVEVKKQLPDIERAVAEALLLPVKVNIYDNQYHSKADGSLDFSSTSSCFQIVGKETYDLKDLEALLTDETNTELKRVYNKYDIEAIERCSTMTSKAETSWVQVCVLVIACLIGGLAVIASCTICCLYSRYKRKTHQKMMKPMTAASTADYMTIRTGRDLSQIGSQILVPTAGSQLYSSSQLSGSHMFISKPTRSLMGSQMIVPKGGSQLLLNQAASQMGSQLIINQNSTKTSYPSSQTGYTSANTLQSVRARRSSQLNGPVFMGSSQMIVPNCTAIVRQDEGYEEQSKFFSPDEPTDPGGQVMYEYVGDGHGNMAYEDSS